MVTIAPISNWQRCRYICACWVQISVDIGMTDAQYGMMTGYAFYLLLSVSMTAQGYCIDKYSLNRVYVVGYGGLLGAAALLIQVGWKL